MTETPSSKISIQWMWKSNSHPWSLAEPAEWSSYSDIEKSIIEQAYQNNQPEVVLDDYQINFKQSVQISNNNQNSQMPVKRIATKKRGGLHRLREQRFMPSPLHPSAPFQDSRLSFSDEVEKYFKVDELYNEFGSSVTLQMMVEKAVTGLIVEGKQVGKQKEAEWMAAQLLEVEKGTHKEVTECCARLYCMDSFLYRRLNECMRLIGDEAYEQLWKQKVRTLGPYAWLLESLENPFTDQKTTVYRSADLSDELIETFCQVADIRHKGINFPAFTSTSRSKEKAEFMDGNVLFVIDINEDEARDLSPYSGFDEEEMLILPYVFFSIVSCCFNGTKPTWLIHLESARA